MKNIADLLEDEEGIEFNVAIRHCGWLSHICALLMHVSCVLPDVLFVSNFQLVINQMVNALEIFISTSAEQGKGLVEVIRLELEAQDTRYFDMMDSDDHDIGLKDAFSQSGFVDAVMDQMVTPYRLGAFLSTLNDVISAYEGFLSEECVSKIWFQGADWWSYEKVAS